MNQITKEQVQKAVHDFLNEQYQSKTEKEQKQLIKAQEESDYEKISELNEKLVEAKNKYSFEAWVEDAANRMAKQLRFGTHISKGVHPDAKGDNVSFFVQGERPFVGSHDVKEKLLDANGNAAALPLAAFFDYPISEEKNLKISDAILSESPDIKEAFSNDKILAESYFNSFYQALVGEIEIPVTHERNKQMLWPVSDKNYISIVPLYPSVFTHMVYKKLNELRFSEENKTARENRFKKTAEDTAYLSISSIAVTKLGGTKPQNVSSLTSKQGGRNYLLPSLPPQFKQNQSFKIQPYADSLFSKGLEYRCRDIFSALVRLIKTDYNNVNIRNARKDILDSLLYKVLAIASTIQEEYPAGWSKDYSLHMSEKLWLDPQRAEQDEQFAGQRQSQEWQQDISNRFANWLNAQLKQQFKQIKHEFADAEHLEWQKEMQEMINETQHQGMEIFQ